MTGGSPSHSAGSGRPTSGCAAGGRRGATLPIGAGPPDPPAQQAVVVEHRDPVGGRATRHSPGRWPRGAGPARTLPTCSPACAPSLRGGRTRSARRGARGVAAARLPCWRERGARAPETLARRLGRGVQPVRERDGFPADHRPGGARPGEAPRGRAQVRQVLRGVQADELRLPERVAQRARRTDEGDARDRRRDAPGGQLRLRADAWSR